MVSNRVLRDCAEQAHDVCVIAYGENARIWNVFGEKCLGPWLQFPVCSPCLGPVASQTMHEDDT